MSAKEKTNILTLYSALVPNVASFDGQPSDATEVVPILAHVSALTVDRSSGAG
jgi:hypothetical protein